MASPAGDLQQSPQRVYTIQEERASPGRGVSAGKGRGGFAQRWYPGRKCAPPWVSLADATSPGDMPVSGHPGSEPRLPDVSPRCASLTDGSILGTQHPAGYAPSPADTVAPSNRGPNIIYTAKGMLVSPPLFEEFVRRRANPILRRLSVAK
jgi:hypothetical protein